MRCFGSTTRPILCFYQPSYCRPFVSMRGRLGPFHPAYLFASPRVSTPEPPSLPTTKLETSPRRVGANRRFIHSCIFIVISRRPHKHLCIHPYPSVGFTRTAEHTFTHPHHPHAAQYTRGPIDRSTSTRPTSSPPPGGAWTPSRPGERAWR